MRILRFATTTLFTVAATLLPCISVDELKAAESKSRPNIVIILADDMGYGDVATLNGDSKIPTPHLDRLAGAGMRLIDAHSPSAVCTPTRYGLLTGRYCWRTQLKRGVLGGYSEPLLAPNRETIATLLKRAGYRTGAVGKWHLGMDLPMKAGRGKETKSWEGDPGVDFSGVIKDSPIHHGFDYYFGVSASLDMAPYVYVRNDRFTMSPTAQQPAVKFPHFVRQGPRAADFVIDEVLDRLTEEAVGFVSAAPKDPRPFFLYLPFTAPHKPTQPHPRFRGRTQLGEYGDFVSQVDASVGRVLETLETTGVAEQTLVFFTSDNGSYMHRYDDPQRADHVDDSTIQGFRADRHRANGPFRGTKADIWEAGHHVPLLVRWPGVVAPGSQSAEPVCLTDLLATAVEAAKGAIPPGQAQDSWSLMPLLRGQTARRAMPVIHHSAAGMFAVRQGRWKLVLGNGSGGRESPRGKPFGKPFQLFDLQADPGEQNNVASEHPDVVTRLTAELNRLRES